MKQCKSSLRVMGTLHKRVVISFLAFSALFVSGCATLQGNEPEDESKNTSLDQRVHTRNVELESKAHTQNPLPNSSISPLLDSRVNDEFVRPPAKLGYVPVLTSPPKSNGDQAAIGRPRMKAKRVDAFVKPLTLPDFIDVVFGEMLQTSYVTGPKVAKMTDVVQLRSSGAMKAGDFLSLVSSALEEYGVRVVAEDGAYRILEEASLRARMPKFIRGRARLSTPAELRPVIQFVELFALDAATMSSFLNQAFGSSSTKIRIQANQAQNYIILSGLPEDVDVALGIIEQLDELRYADSQIRRYSPKYWNVKEFEQELTAALSVEGWQVTGDSRRTTTIFLLGVEYSNDLFIFSKSLRANPRIDFWIKELDKPVTGGDAEQIFIFQVKNVDAETLAETANSVLMDAQDGNVGLQINGDAQSNVLDANTRGTFGRNGRNENNRGRQSGGKFTVDMMGNRIIFTGTLAERDKIFEFLTRLDTPTPEVLIEVKIAEVTLTDNTNFGVQFFIDDLGGENIQYTARSSGLGLGSSGLTVGLLSGNVDASINAFATNRRVKLLSTPVLVARSGGNASIQVGTDVPVITSRRAANNQNGVGNTDILQSIEYRSTGVLMDIEPIVFSKDRIDLTISQEVSATIDVQNSSISSPTISNRFIQTQLSLEDGQTAILGGLIQENKIVDEKGIPIFKDIPFIGNLFSNESLSVDRTELIVLITAYVLQGQADRSIHLRHYKRTMKDIFSEEDRFSTLLPKKF